MARKRKQATIIRLAAPTARVRVDEMRRHPVYGKQFRASTSLLTHVPATVTAEPGDVVLIEEIRPVSKRKAWQIVEVVKRAGVVVADSAIEVDGKEQA